MAIDHFSRKVVASCPLEGPNAGWVVEALEEAFLRHGSPKHLITDQEKVFTSEVFRDLLWRWRVKQRLGAVGKHGSIAVTEVTTARVAMQAETSRASKRLLARRHGGLEHAGPADRHGEERWEFCRWA